MTYIPPTVLESKFTCPHCEAIAMQSWESRNEQFYKPGGPAAAGGKPQYLIRIAHCAHCRKYSLWHDQSMGSSLKFCVTEKMQLQMLGS